MTDNNQLYNDFKMFSRRMRRRYGYFEYITAVEPQQRGAWHMHCILLFDDEAPYMKNSEVADLWGHGFVNIQACNDVDNLGAYLSAYMCDLEVSPELSSGNIVEHEINGVTKKYIKGARLKLYPPGMNIFRWSRGIKRPIVTQMPYRVAQSKLESYTKTYESYDCITSDKSDFALQIKKEYYKKYVRGS